MDFGLSEEQREIAALAQQILGDQVTPESLQPYETREQDRFDRDLWRALSESGLLGIAIREENGGMGFGFNELCSLYECCGEALAPVPLLQTTVAGIALQQATGFETELAGIANGEYIGTFAPQSQVSRSALLPAPVVSDGKVNGTVQFVPYFSQSSHVLVVAHDASGDTSLLLVNAKDSSIASTALQTSSFEPQHVLTFNDTPARKVGGTEAVRLLEAHYTTALCAFQFGAVDRMVKLTAEYTSDREQFGVKLSTFQAVAHRAANCYIDTTCLQLATQHAASRLAAGLDATEEVHTAKAWCGDVGHRVSYSTQHLHGGMGVDRTYPLWRYALWAKQCEMVMGTSSDHLFALGERIAEGAFEIDL